MGTAKPLIAVDELAAHPEGCLIVDCRFRMAEPQAGHEAYLAGHVPGAVYASLDTDLSDLGKTDRALGRHPLPEAGAFAAALGCWGWREGMPVVACDAGNGAMAAARLWWLLGWAGIPARVLNGGMAAWLAAGLPLEQGEAAPVRTTPKVYFDPTRVVFAERLTYELGDPRTLLVDARATARYRGEQEPIDPVAGHVPGAVNRPFALNLDADGNWKTPEVLRDEFTALIGDREPSSVIHMCGSGVTACHNLLAMDVAGLSGSRLYAPSWSGWIADRNHAVATGPR